MSTVEPQEVTILTTGIPLGYKGTIGQQHAIRRASLDGYRNLNDLIEECEWMLRADVADDKYNAVIGVTYSHAPIFQANGQQRDIVDYSVLIAGHAAIFNPPLEESSRVNCSR